MDPQDRKRGVRLFFGITVPNAAYMSTFANRPKFWSKSVMPCGHDTFTLTRGTPRPAGERTTSGVMIEMELSWQTRSVVECSSENPKFR